MFVWYFFVGVYWWCGGDFGIGGGIFVCVGVGGYFVCFVGLYFWNCFWVVGGVGDVDVGCVLSWFFMMGI